MKFTVILLTIVSALSLLSGAEAVCCHTKRYLSFTIGSGQCSDLKARPAGRGCEITICADGVAVGGNYCGVGSCNIFGCNCDGGCRTGNFKQSFIDRNRGNQITVTVDNDASGLG